MIDWSLVAKLVGGGFGVTILIMSIMALAVWILGVILRRTVGWRPCDVSR